MRITATIAEYNPLHSGHATHLAAAKKDTDADHVIAVMSGDYVQRGCPSILPKYERAHSALLAGADLVLELPLYYSTGSLEYFAMGAVSLIQKTGLVSCISFGSECGDINMLKEAARLTSALTDEQEVRLKDLISSGISYSNAINSVCSLPEEMIGLLRQPNNLLAVSYIRAAGTLGFECSFHTLQRAGSAYHDDSAGALSSTSIRKELLSQRERTPDFTDMDGCLYKTLSGRMSEEICTLILNCLKDTPAISEDDLSLLLFYRLSSLEDMKMLTSYLDVTDNLAGKIINEYRCASSYSDLCSRLKSKDLNYARISRALLHILLDIRKEYMEEYRNNGYNFYIKPLAFKKDSDRLMHELKTSSSVPLISKNADAGKVLTEPGLRMFREGIKADDLYNKTACTLSRRPFRSEYERSVIVI